MLKEVQAISPQAHQSIMNLFNQKQLIENFATIDLIAPTGLSLPGVIIPVLTGLTTFLSTWVLNKQQATSSDSTMKTQQTMMLVVMPLMMTWMTTSLSAGVGIYWITSSVYQTIQQVLLNKYYTRDGAVLIEGAGEKQPKEIVVLDKSKNKKKGEK
jgi:YidC/Oxa1 family membrane protein insertase